MAYDCNMLLHQMVNSRCSVGWNYRLSVLQLVGSIALSVRGECDFTTKAEVVQSGGAVALLVVNDEEGDVELNYSTDGWISLFCSVYFLLIAYIAYYLPGPTTDLFEMVCPSDSTSLNISIPVVMVAKSAGSTLKAMLATGQGEFYAPWGLQFSGWHSNNQTIQLSHNQT